MLDMSILKSVETAKNKTFNFVENQPKVSPAIHRLMEEIRNKAAVNSVNGSYDRTHNRHNRGQ